MKRRTTLRRRTRLSPMSTGRRDELEQRADVVRAVLERDRVCRGHGLNDTCTRIPTDVHELKRGAYRADCWLDPDRCIALCRPCHRRVTNHPNWAVKVGLALFSWQEFPE